MKLADPSKLPTWEKVTNHGPGRGVYVQKGLDTSGHICRYMSAQNFRSTILQSQIYMSNVRLWTDPYERLWCDELFRDGSTLSDVNAYGSCWTRRMWDEPFWRLYQDRCDHTDNEGKLLPAAPPPVRIKARISNLISVFGDQLHRAEAKVFIGEIAYCREAAVLAYAASLRESSKEVASDAASALHLKRNAFWFEREVRALWIDRDGIRDARMVGFDPQDLIDGVMIGPTLDVATARHVKSEIVEMGIAAKKVKRSLIYRLPK